MERQEGLVKKVENSHLVLFIAEGSLFAGNNPWGKQELGKEIGAALHEL